ncbi:endonuclease/exonuclease/phosphatase family protein [Kiloniella laminariae]|uniref:Endonuclease/exonuclease/phosphatase family protein n=1 Tax=Kiloniella laminariae TaxID=454162 RepID=A0ABT4LP99_9PROT|nr:endonuclease/exonuclease/phosphatase family protein [Kiloniella laminariae]MCZ4282954.1 endonuclease/exonuclease/phosphatase family protein [Kiloniella laminariae]
MKLVSYNIQYGTGQDGVYDLERIIASLAGADIIMLQEVERHWERTNHDDQVSRIAAAFPDHYSAFGGHCDLDGSYRDETGKLIQRRRQHGTMILSRVPLLSLRTFLLPGTAVVSPQFSLQRGLQEALIEWEGRRIRLYNTHLNHICPELQAPQIEKVMEIINDAPATGLAWSGGDPKNGNWGVGGEPAVPEDVILTGDMNLCHYDPGYSDFVGPKSRWYGRVATRRHLMDSWTLAGHAEEEGDSCPPYGRLDYCFVSPSLGKAVAASKIDTDNKSSDHYPYWVDFDFSKL